MHRSVHVTVFPLLKALWTCCRQETLQNSARDMVTNGSSSASQISTQVWTLVLKYQMSHRHLILGTCSTSIFKWQFSPTPYAPFHMFKYSIHHCTYMIMNLYLYLYQKIYSTFKIRELIQMSRWNPRSCQRPCSGRCIARIRLLGLGCRWRDSCFFWLSDLSYFCWEPGYVKVYNATSGSSQATWSFHYIFV